MPDHQPTNPAGGNGNDLDTRDSVANHSDETNQHATGALGVSDSSSSCTAEACPSSALELKETITSPADENEEEYPIGFNLVIVVVALVMTMFICALDLASQSKPSAMGTYIILTEPRLSSQRPFPGSHYPTIVLITGVTQGTLAALPSLSLSYY
ncbi:hypothetical protein F4818DRAFT_395691 [Hypoxylon cercidicola]|nr:hypothetical protein F4818DRAFT_395691 [Hypoxylon cercidicola]